MRETFSGAWAEHRARGRFAVAAFLVRTTLDMVGTGVRERVRRRRRSGRRVGGRGFRGRFARGASGGGGPLFTWLDVRLGFRMLVKHPGLTLVSTFALAVGIPVGLAPTHIVGGLMAPLPVPQGQEIRLLRQWSPALGKAARSTTHDFEVWSEALTSFERLAAFRQATFNVDPGEGGGTAVRGAEVTASAFTTLRVGPLLGRPIQPSDEEPGADPVVVLGHDLWQARFGGDPSIIGRVVRVGSTPRTVVGVMPEGFLFPTHEGVWVPLAIPTLDDPANAPSVGIFGRLAEGVDAAQAQAEFASVAAHSALPGSDPRMQPQVVGFAYTQVPGLSGGLRGSPEWVAFEILALVILLVACANVGMLVFARTANRAGELSVRTALGATRAHIVSQVFVECLVLAVVASGAGLVLLAAVLRLMWSVLPAALTSAAPWWIDWSIGPGTVVHALALAGVSAVVAGVAPALRFTGRSVQANIQRARARQTGLRMGGLSGALIVTDVAVAVTAVGFALTAAAQVRDAGAANQTVNIPAAEYLAATVSFPLDAGAEGGTATDGARSAGRWAAAQEELVRRLREDPRVSGVAVADALPRMNHDSRLVEAEGLAPPADRRGTSTRLARVAVDFFRSLDQSVLIGRDFGAGDLVGARSAVIVNTTFVQNVLGGQSAVGRRIRFVPWGDGEPGPWMEIVGVVGHLGTRMISAENDQAVYEPFAPGELRSVRLGIHVGEDPTGFATTLRTVAGQVDPDLMVSVIGPLDRVYEGDWYFLIALTTGAAFLVGVLLALAASGIYAILSFAVAERTTEIGIRAALGAGRRELILSVAGRALAQLGLGVVLGIPMATLFTRMNQTSPYAATGQALAVGVTVMVLVGLVACTGPTLRALRVHPSEALKG
ncbi:MAG TPA: ABC transporter permease [Longimicrobiales bacterium]|nr:ABC transporter permease [Longimicrobiales bacterium]